MQKHGPDPLAGPLRGTSAWWHGRGADESPPLEPQADAAPVAEIVATPPPARVRKRGPRKIRTELVDRVRKEIAAGTYDTADKFQAALEKLLDKLWD